MPQTTYGPDDMGGADPTTGDPAADNDAGPIAAAASFAAQVASKGNSVTWVRADGTLDPTGAKAVVKENAATITTVYPQYQLDLVAEKGGRNVLFSFTPADAARLLPGALLVYPITNGEYWTLSAPVYTRQADTVVQVDFLGTASGIQ